MKNYNKVKFETTFGPLKGCKSDRNKYMLGIVEVCVPKEITDCTDMTMYIEKNYRIICITIYRIKAYANTFTLNKLTNEVQRSS